MTETSDLRELPGQAEMDRALSLWLLRPALTDAQLLAGCRDAVAAGLGSVTVFPSDAERALRALEGSAAVAVAVAGFPYGASTTAAKLYEARDLLRRGVREVGFVLNAAQLVSREFQQVETELMQIGRSCAEAGARLHAIVESSLLADDLRVIVTKICKRCDAQMLSIAAGAGPAADALGALDLFRRIARDELELGLMAPELGLDSALEAWRRGAARLCCGNAVELAGEWKARLQAQAESGQGAG
jgi:deoxyribose-phosphate aldolase